MVVELGERREEAKRSRMCGAANVVGFGCRATGVGRRDARRPGRPRRAAAAPAAYIRRSAGSALLATHRKEETRQHASPLKFLS